MDRYHATLNNLTSNNKVYFSLAIIIYILISNYGYHATLNDLTSNNKVYCDVMLREVSNNRAYFD